MQILKPHQKHSPVSQTHRITEPLTLTERRRENENIKMHTNIDNVSKLFYR